MWLPWNMPGSPRLVAGWACSCPVTADPTEPFSGAFLRRAACGLIISLTGLCISSFCVAVASPNFVSSTPEREATSGWKLSFSAYCPKGSRVGLDLLLSTMWREWWKTSGWLLQLPKCGSRIYIRLQCLSWLQRWHGPGCLAGRSRAEAGPQKPLRVCARATRQMCGGQHVSQLPWAVRGLNILQVSGTRWLPSDARAWCAGTVNGRSVSGWLAPRAVRYLIGYLIFLCWNHTHPLAGFCLTRAARWATAASL